MLKDIEITRSFYPPMHEQCLKNKKNKKNIHCKPRGCGDRVWLLVWVLSRFARKPVFGVSDQVIPKPGCTASEIGWRLEIRMGLCYLCSENADLRLCFLHMQKAGFLMMPRKYFRTIYYQNLSQVQDAKINPQKLTKFTKTESYMTRSMNNLGA